ncbi:insulin-like receptor [Lycorma delicatula]|uniref:insulin-like receptor n=1 Tax=Lycorma delicatula TaxID=130591 RepID=UPI003F50E165
MEDSAYCHCSVQRPKAGRSGATRRPGICGRPASSSTSSSFFDCKRCVLLWTSSGSCFGCGDDVSWTLPFLLLLCLSVATAAQLRPDTDISIKREEGVCQSRDIRNSVREFSQLNGCRVVEGFVQIVLIDKANESEYANISFPELREITGYLLLYRVNGLRSLSHIFPNLAVIRGNTLFFNYALVIFEMLHLQELGLKSLTDILRGAVYLNKNPSLCFVDTIDWNKIAHMSIDGHYIMGNKKKNECPICPTTQICPTSSTGDSLCWNSQHCQKLCPHCKQGQACMADGTCCDENCTGGCNSTGNTGCVACRGVLFQDKCLTACPRNTFKYLNRRCVLESECYDMPKPREKANEDMRLKPWIPFENECRLECPLNYMEVKIESPPGEKYYSCERCKGPCKKECEGLSVDSIASAQKLRGCTYIKSSLEIQIRGGSNVVKELEENLNMIEEINGYLKIVRSFPIVSLNFLKKLRIIHGNFLENNKNALVVLDNQNLVELWDFETRNISLEIRNGKLFFHFNPKLCIYKIESLRKHANLLPFSEMEVASNSNGDKVACTISELEARVTKKHSCGALIEWNQFEHYDSRTLLSYVLFYIEAPYQNVTLYDGRDACGKDGWLVDDVPLQDTPKNEPLRHILTRLKPYTQYAFYVKTYTIATEKTGAQSPIQYFRTDPDTPTKPILPKAYSNSSHELVISWFPPNQPNGNVTHYIIQGTWERDDQNFLQQRNYCKEPLSLTETKHVDMTNTEFNEVKDGDRTEECNCKDGKKPPDIEARDKEAQFQIHFENNLHNLVYVKRTRVKREIEKDGKLFNGNNEYPETEQSKVATTVTNTENNIKDDKETFKSFKHVVWGQNLLVVRNLQHFAQYTISIRACRERVPNENTSLSSNCSDKSIVTARTLQHVPADAIPTLNHRVVEMSNHTLGAVKIWWDEPPSPNGLIVTYQIEYRLVDIENVKPIIECITRRDFLEQGKSYTLQNLTPGNYSLKVHATSLAGNGDFTSVQYFQIKGPPAVSKLQIIVGVIVGVLLFVLCVMVIYLRRQYNRGIPKNRLIATVNPEYVSTAYVPDEWEVPRNQIELIRELGQGSFGMVYEGIAHNIVPNESNKPCAIKTVTDNATDRERMEFLNEASVMKAFNTYHVVRLLGVVSKGQPTLVVMELMANGDLKSYLRSHRPDVTDDVIKQPPSLRRILQMAVEIADGMAYLSAKKFVHRDLAARNCMVAEDLTVKIGDFGMTRDIYETDYYRKGTKGLLPVRWMAPESLKDGVFSTSSDVWSFGVVLWEMATLASQPYQGLSNDQVLKYVKDGGVMERPDDCPDKLYNLMRLCWQHKPTLRPNFLDLVSCLLNDADPDFPSVSFYHSEEGVELRGGSTSVGAMGGEDTPLCITREVEDFSLSDDEDFKQPQSSGSSKVSNGSTTPTPNGYIVRHHNGNNIKTTKC